MERERRKCVMMVFVDDDGDNIMKVGLIYMMMFYGDNIMNVGG